MSVVVLLSGKLWTSVNATELNDHITLDGAINGPTLISRDQQQMAGDEGQLYKYLNARQIKDRVWSTNDAPAVVISKFYTFGYKLISQAGSSSGFSGKARYSADVAVTDYRWSWTMVRECIPPPPYPRELQAQNTM